MESTIEKLTELTNLFYECEEQLSNIKSKLIQRTNNDLLTYYKEKDYDVSLQLLKFVFYIASIHQGYAFGKILTHYFIPLMLYKAKTTLHHVELWFKSHIRVYEFISHINKTSELELEERATNKYSLFYKGNKEFDISIHILDELYSYDFTVNTIIFKPLDQDFNNIDEKWFESSTYDINWLLDQVKQKKYVLTGEYHNILVNGEKYTDKYLQTYLTCLNETHNGWTFEIDLVEPTSDPVDVAWSQLDLSEKYDGTYNPIHYLYNQFICINRNISLSALSKSNLITLMQDFDDVPLNKKLEIINAYGEIKKYVSHLYPKHVNTLAEKYSNPILTLYYYVINITIEKDYRPKLNDFLNIF